MRDYYAEYLQSKNSVNTLDIAVSKVSTGQDKKTIQAFDTFDTTSFSSNQKNCVYEKPVVTKADKLQKALNQYIEAGITFDVAAFDFKVIDPLDVLKTSDREFLELNNAAVLCCLQQSLLMKHLFSIAPEGFEDFSFEIEERKSIMTKIVRSNYGLYGAAEIDVTQRWFERLINEQTF